MNGEDLKREWKRVYDMVVDGSADPSQASAFLSRLVPQAMSDGFLMLTADTDFIKGWIEKHYAEAIAGALREIHGRDFTVALEVDPNQEAPAAPARAAEPAAQKPAEATPASAPPLSPKPEQTPAEAPAAQAGAAERGEAGGQEPSRAIGDGMIAPTSSLTFENFVIGASNQMAYSMAVAVAEAPGGQMLNPLFIYGRSGLGKTHLMRAIQNYIVETRPEMKTVYVDSADFLAGYVEATIAHDKQKSSYKDFKNTYQEADVLLIDDIQYLQGKEQTLDIVFQIFNFMVDQGKQVVLSADRAPKNITMDERYKSRFNSGGTFDIQPPEVETKMGIIKSFVDEYCATSNSAFVLPEEIGRYIAENSSSNIRELKSAVTKVIYAMNAFGKSDITVEEVSRLLENHFSGGTMRKLTIPDIQKQVEQYYGVSHTELIGHKRARKIVHARQVAIYLSREMLDLPYNSIAKSFGDRDHTTILYSVTNVEEKMRSNRELSEEIENIKRKIKEMQA